MPAHCWAFGGLPAARRDWILEQDDHVDLGPPHPFRIERYIEEAERNGLARTGMGLEPATRPFMSGRLMSRQTLVIFVQPAELKTLAAMLLATYLDAERQLLIPTGFIFDLCEPSRAGRLR